MWHGGDAPLEQESAVVRLLLDLFLLLPEFGRTSYHTLLYME